MSKTTKSQFSRIYIRQSRSEFDDHSTLLLLADVISADENSILLGYDNYIYLHRHESGECLGLSVSKQLLRDTPEIDSDTRYLVGVEMFAVLLLHLDRIKAFCELFHEEFFRMFMLPPSVYFVQAEQAWLQFIEDN